MKQNLFRQKSMEHISSPEQLDDYLRVTNPAVWVVLTAVILLLAGFLFWSSITAIESYAEGVAEARNGVLTITFEDETKAKNVKIGMDVEVGEVVTPVLSVGQNEEGRIIAIANINMPDGRYDIRVGYKTTQMIRLLFN